MTRYILEPCDPDRITACDLQGYITEAQRAGTRTETFRIIPLNPDGYRESIHAQMLWYPDDMRAGIAYGAVADWTDADSPEHALALWRADAMVP